jgi:hypothetical protein
VAHFSRLFKIVIDVPASAHGREVSFWQAAPLPPFGDRPSTAAFCLKGIADVTRAHHRLH